jgi:DUF971 family protein
MIEQTNSDSPKVSGPETLDPKIQGPQLKVPSKIAVRDQGRTMHLEYGDGLSATLRGEYLRIESPSAEVKGHAGVGGTLPTGKRYVKISAVEPVGHYAVAIHFDDGHDSGIYTWQHLRHLIRQEKRLWADYEKKLREQGSGREPDVQIIRLMDPPK